MFNKEELKILFEIKVENELEIVRDRVLQILNQILIEIVNKLTSFCAQLDSK